MAMLSNRARTNQRADSHHVITVDIRYVQSIDSSGWLKVKLEPSGQLVFLCEYTKVLLLKDENGRTHFTIKEGPYSNKNASLTTTNAQKTLIKARRSSGANITVTITGRQRRTSAIRNNETFNQLISTLSFNGDSAIVTLDSDIDYIETNKNSPNYNKVLHSKPLPKGNYKILAPDYAKNANMTAYYRTHPAGFSGLKYDTVWFPIEYAANYNSSFVHVGNLSEGCVTVWQLEKWNALYAYLIKNRLDSKGVYVGTLTIQ